MHQAHLYLLKKVLLLSLH